MHADLGPVTPFGSLGLLQRLLFFPLQKSGPDLGWGVQVEFLDLEYFEHL